MPAASRSVVGRRARTQVSREDRPRHVSVARAQASIASRAAAYLRHDRAPSHARYPEGLALARPQPADDDRDVRAGGSQREAGGDRGDRATTPAEGDISTDCRAARLAQGPTVMESRTGVMPRGAARLSRDSPEPR